MHLVEAFDWSSLLEEWWDRIKQRIVSLTIAVSLHMMLLALALLNWRYDKPAELTSPIQVMMIDQEAQLEQPAPSVPEVTMEQPRTDVVVPVEVQIDIEPSPNAISLPAQPSAPALAPSSAPAAASSPWVTPPRFDADYLSNPAPAYPAISRRLGEQGVVLLRVRVTAVGTAAEVRIERSSGSGRLDSAAIEAVQRWRFVPARRGTDAIEAWVLVPIEFELKR